MCVYIYIHIIRLNDIRNSAKLSTRSVATSVRYKSLNNSKICQSGSKAEWNCRTKCEVSNAKSVWKAEKIRLSKLRDPSDRCQECTNSKSVASHRSSETEKQPAGRAACQNTGISMPNNVTKLIQHHFVVLSTQVHCGWLIFPAETTQLVGWLTLNIVTTLVCISVSTGPPIFWCWLCQPAGVEVSKFGTCRHCRHMKFNNC